MKKSFHPSFSKGLIAFGFCAAVVAMTACSESSSSGGGATAPDNPSNPIVSNCALANKYLPTSTIAYVDDGNGGCTVVGQNLSVDEYIAYDAALVSSGFLKSESLSESSIYKKTLEDASILTVSLSYASEQQSLSATVTKLEKNYVFGDIEKVAELYITPILKEFYSSEIIWNGSFDDIKNKFELKIEDGASFCSQLAEKMKAKGLLNINTNENASNDIDVNAYVQYNGASYSIVIKVFGFGKNNVLPADVRTSIKKM